MNKVAKRRIKLFEDASHYGAKIIDGDGWTCAVCRTYDQAHVFGRGKPKVIPGTNDIDPMTNLRDDEGITAEKRKLRDSNADYVKDGISQEFDAQPFEAGWCVMGGNPWYSGSTLKWGPGLRPCESYAHVQVYCNGKVDGEVCPLLVFLGHATGKLYISNLQYSKYGMMDLGGGWCVSDYNCELNGSTEGGIRRRILRDKAFAAIYQEAAVESMDGMTGAVEIDVLASARGNGNVKRDGVSVISLYSDMFTEHVRTGMRLFIKADGQKMPVSGIIEGLNSSVVFVISPAGRAISISEFIDYCKAHSVGDPDFRNRLICAKVDNLTLEIKPGCSAADDDCTLFV